MEASMVVCFDLVGTLFAMDRIAAVFRTHGIPEETLPLWFARLLHVVMASTMTGRYTPFLAGAAAALRQVLALRDLPREAVPAVLEALPYLEPWPDTRPCLSALRARGHTVVALSNASPEMERSLIEGNGLGGLFAAVLSSDAAGRCKPDPAPYRMALDALGVSPAGACMVAAHAWDVLGASAVGLRTVWVSRVEKAWSFPGAPPDAAVPTLDAVPDAVDRMGRA
jgi:2-haloacid dehalogenase